LPAPFVVMTYLLFYNLTVDKYCNNGINDDDWEGSQYVNKLYVTYLSDIYSINMLGKISDWHQVINIGWPYRVLNVSALYLPDTYNSNMQIM